MKITFIKLHGGVLSPINETEAERLKRFKNGEAYEVDITLTRSPHFHRKVFAFFDFCFDHWSAEYAGYECSDEYTQKEEFRKNLTILAGFYDVVTTMRGETRLRAKSLAYASMDDEEFSRCYSALINAAIKHVFSGTKDKEILNRLQSFF